MSSQKRKQVILGAYLGGRFAGALAAALLVLAAVPAAVAIGAPVQGLKRYPKVYRSLSLRTPGYLCINQVPPKLSSASRHTKDFPGHCVCRW